MSTDRMTDRLVKRMAKREERRKQMTDFRKSGEIYFYYLRDDKNQIFGGAALKKDGNSWCRGISLWAESIDKFDREECRRQAMKRLTHAVMSGKDDCPSLITTGRESGKKLAMFYPSFFVHDYGFKSRFNARLTEKEMEIVKTTIDAER